MYTATYKDGHIICEKHGDLGKEEEARKQHKFMYQEQTYYCMDCIGEDVAASEEPTLRECPYCHQLHQVEHIEQCPLKPKHGNGKIST